MFQNLSEKLTNVVKEIRGQARLTEDNVQDALREVRMALLEADVALPVVKEFIERVRERALGTEVIGTLTPGQAMVRVVRDELTAIMGGESSALNFAAEPPVVILMAGLQGAGKTTTAAKLALRLKESEKKNVAMVSCDIHRPAAIEQLAILAKEVDVTCYPTDQSQPAAKIASTAIDQARKDFKDVLIVDTAGRITLDEGLMTEVADVKSATGPHETLLVADSLTGQDAVNTAKAFDERVGISGIVLTRIDGDGRGGAALSMRAVTGKPIKLLGTGEKWDALEDFHPERIAGRILGMGDVVSLVERAALHAALPFQKSNQNHHDRRLHNEQGGTCQYDRTGEQPCLADIERRSGRVRLAVETIQDLSQCTEGCGNHDHHGQRPQSGKDQDNGQRLLKT